MRATRGISRYVIERKNNIVRVDFRRPDPPAPNFPGAGALRSEDSVIDESPRESWNTSRADRERNWATG